jgi:hypothetical protein
VGGLMLMAQGNIVTKQAFDALAREVEDLRRQIEALKALNKPEQRAYKPFQKKEIQDGLR